MASLPWVCDFGTSVLDVFLCGFEQDSGDSDDWSVWSGLTPSPHSGPYRDEVNAYGRKTTSLVVQIL